MKSTTQARDVHVRQRTKKLIGRISQSVRCLVGYVISPIHCA